MLILSIPLITILILEFTNVYKKNGKEKKLGDQQK